MQSRPFEQIYDALPVQLQNAVCSLEGWRIARTRYNSDFRQRLVDAERRLTMSCEELAAYRDRRLAEFVMHAARSVPYYRDLFARLGADPREFRSLGDLARLPILNKATVQDDPLAFVSRDVPRHRRVSLRTGGTTGGGLPLVSTHSALREQHATWWRYFRRHGIEPGTWCAYFSGRTIVPIARRAPPFWRVNRPGRQILFSSFHTWPEHLDAYLYELRRAKVPWIHGYPSQIAQLAAHILSNDIDLGFRVRWITTASENLLPRQASLIEQAFGVRPVQHYGMTEAVANIWQCEAGGLHVDEDFSAVELIPANDGGTQHSVIGTNLSNPAMPLLRYDTQDLVTVSLDRCACGRSGRCISRIDGRATDSVELENGAPSGPIDFIFEHVAHIREFQVVQRAAGDLKFRIVRTDGFNGCDEKAMRQAIERRFGAQARCVFEFVEHLERCGNGKLRFVVDERRSRGCSAAAGMRRQFHAAMAVGLQVATVL